MRGSNVGGAGEIKRSAAFARDQINTLLTSLHTEHTAGRQKALRQFEEYFFQFRPDLEENDARTLLEGDAMRRGLVAECGAMSENHVGELKKTGAEVLSLITRMVTDSRPSLVQTIFARLKLQDLQEMQLEKHMLPQKRHHTARGTLDAHVLVDAILNNEGGIHGDDGDIKTPEQLLQNNEQAICLHEAWEEEQDSESGSEEEAEQLPTKWADVVLEIAASKGESAMNSLVGIAQATHSSLNSGNSSRSKADVLRTKKDPLGIITLDLRALGFNVRHRHTSLSPTHRAPVASVGMDDRRKGSGHRRGATSTLTDLTKRGVHKLNKRMGSAMDLVSGGGGGGSSSSSSNGGNFSEKPNVQACGRTTHAATSVRARAMSRTPVRAVRGGMETSQGSIFTSDEDFSPQLFLQRAHKGTSYSDLINGLKHLRAEAGSTTIQLNKLVHTFFDEFVGCRDTIDSIQQMVEKELSDSSQAEPHGADQRVQAQPCSQLRRAELSLQHADSTARRLFAPLLQRSEEARGLRNTLGVLRRFRSFFNLPASMRLSLESNDFEQVVADYEQAQLLRQHDNIAVLRQVLAEVEAVASDVRMQLLELLESEGGLEVSMQEQERVIALLLKLGSSHCSNSTDARTTVDEGDVEVDSRDEARMNDPLYYLLVHRHQLVLRILTKMEEQHVSSLKWAKRHWEWKASSSSTTSPAASVESPDRHLDSALAGLGLELSPTMAFGGDGEEEMDRRIKGLTDSSYGVDIADGVGVFDSADQEAWEDLLTDEEKSVAMGNPSLRITLSRLSAQYVDSVTAFIVKVVPGLLRITQLLLRRCGGGSRSNSSSGSDAVLFSNSVSHERGRIIARACVHVAFAEVDNSPVGKTPHRRSATLSVVNTPSVGACARAHSRSSSASSGDFGTNTLTDFDEYARHAAAAAAKESTGSDLDWAHGVEAMQLMSTFLRLCVKHLAVPLLPAEAAKADAGLHVGESQSVEEVGAEVGGENPKDCCRGFSQKQAPEGGLTASDAAAAALESGAGFGDFLQKVGAQKRQLEETDEGIGDNFGALSNGVGACDLLTESIVCFPYLRHVVGRISDCFEFLCECSADITSARGAAASIVADIVGSEEVLALMGGLDTVSQAPHSTSPVVDGACMSWYSLRQGRLAFAALLGSCSRRLVETRFSRVAKSTSALYGGERWERANGLAWWAHPQTDESQMSVLDVGLGALKSEGLSPSTEEGGVMAVLLQYQRQNGMEHRSQDGTQAKRKGQERLDLNYHTPLPRRFVQLVHGGLNEIRTTVAAPMHVCSLVCEETVHAVTALSNCLLVMADEDYEYSEYIGSSSSDLVLQEGHASASGSSLLPCSPPPYSTRLLVIVANAICVRCAEGMLPRLWAQLSSVFSPASGGGSGGCAESVKEIIGCRQKCENALKGVEATLVERYIELKKAKVQSVMKKGLVKAISRGIESLAPNQNPLRDVRGYATDALLLLLRVEDEVFSILGDTRSLSRTSARSHILRHVQVSLARALFDQFYAWGRKSSDVKNRSLSVESFRQVAMEVELLIKALGHLLSKEQKAEVHSFLATLADCRPAFLTLVPEMIKATAS